MNWCLGNDRSARLPVSHNSDVGSTDKLGTSCRSRSVLVGEPSHSIREIWVPLIGLIKLTLEFCVLQIISVDPRISSKLAVWMSPQGKIMVQVSRWWFVKPNVVQDRIPSHDTLIINPLTIFFMLIMSNLLLSLLIEFIRFTTLLQQIKSSSNMFAKKYWTGVTPVVACRIVQYFSRKLTLETVAFHPSDFFFEFLLQQLNKTLR